MVQMLQIAFAQLFIHNSTGLGPPGRTGGQIVGVGAKEVDISLFQKLQRPATAAEGEKGLRVTLEVSTACQQGILVFGELLSAGIAVHMGKHRDQTQPNGDLANILHHMIRPGTEGHFHKQQLCLTNLQRNQRLTAANAGEIRHLCIE